MKSQRPLKSLAIATFLSFACSLRADVRLPALFSDKMVLQRGIRLPVWGWAEDGEEVTVSFRGETAKTKAKNGKWAIKLSRQKAGGPDTLVVQGKNKIVINDVLVGEVWICSGQSNMEWPLNQSFEAAPDIAVSANANLRLYLVPKTRSEKPLEDVKASWKNSGPDSVPGFSAVAYYFGRDLQKALGVPVGLIETCWGGSPAEVWMSQQVLEANPEYKRDILDAYNAAVAKAEAATPKGQKPFWRPTELYNGMIAPLLPYGIKGAIWYQGESNAGHAYQYRTLFADMIRNWRRDWNEGDFTFLAVQLAPFKAIKDQPAESDWAELREAQNLATKVLPKVGIAVITDVGDEKDIHPKKKAPVGGRLALGARGIAYGERIEYSGPIYRSMKVKGDKAIISFDHTGGGLIARDGDLKGFAICGPDKKFVWGKAQIEGNKIVVTASEVSKPVAVRFGWADYPVVNLWNKDGLPASPFRTDDFPMITAPKK